MRFGDCMQKGRSAVTTWMCSKWRLRHCLAKHVASRIWYVVAGFRPLKCSRTLADHEQSVIPLYDLGHCLSTALPIEGQYHVVLAKPEVHALAWHSLNQALASSNVHSSPYWVHKHGVWTRSHLFHASSARALLNRLHSLVCCCHSLHRETAIYTMARSSGFRSILACTAILSLFGAVTGFQQQVVDFGAVGADVPLSPLELKIKSPGDDLFPGPQTQAIQGLDGEEAPPHTHMHEKRVGSGAPYWVSQIKRQGKNVYGNNASYVIWRNVRDYGAKGDGVTDDVDAINNATADGNRCGLGCDSQLTAPAIVYFPPGTYMVSRPIIMYYFTQYIGDANDLPTLKATPDFNAIGVIDSNVYLPYGFNWYQNQNNMWRQVRNFIIDITLVEPTRPVHGIHWQVAQATSLQNIVFNMVQGTLNDGNQQQGVFMDNGSGGHLEDLIFNGGGIGFFAGNQQFTCRNLTFNNCETAIFQNWNWVFLYKSIFINNCGIAFDVTQGGDVPATGSVTLQDSVISNSQYGVITSFSTNSTPVSAGTFILDNVNFINTNPAVQWKNNTPIVPGNRLIESFVQGRVYSAFDSVYQGENNLTCHGPAASSSRIQQLVGAPQKPASLLGPDGKSVLERTRPQYEGVPVENFKSIMDFGCSGDGVSDATQCVQNFFNSIQDGQIAYIDHGAYLIRSTVTIPNNIKIVGEMWPLLMADGTSPNWQDKNNPQVVFRVGQPGDKGTVEMSDLVFTTRGSAVGAIVMEWNLAGTYPGATGMWDTHFRIGGYNGSLLQSDTCTKSPNTAHGPEPQCWAAFLLLHMTSTASAVMSNNWGWVADHEMDLTDHNQIDVYNGRGFLCESQGPMWIYGSSFEHSQLYNYNFANAKEIYMGVIQSETA